MLELKPSNKLYRGYFETIKTLFCGSYINNYLINVSLFQKYEIQNTTTNNTIFFFFLIGQQPTIPFKSTFKGNNIIQGSSAKKSLGKDIQFISNSSNLLRP